MSYELILEHLNFKSKFENLQDIEVGDKPYYDNNKICYSKNYYGQSLVRYIYGINRNNFISKFTEDLIKFKQLVKQCKDYNFDLVGVILDNTLIPNNKILNQELKEMKKILLIFCNKLKHTYNSDIQFIEKVEICEEILRD